MNVELSVTEQCNLRCSYCYGGESRAACGVAMSDEVMEAAVRLALDRASVIRDFYLNITFFGGEPLLRMDFIERTVRFAKAQVRADAPKLRKRFRLLFTVKTNGTLLTDEILSYLNKEHFSVVLSLDGPGKRHDISRVTADGKGSFRAIRPFIPALAKMNAGVESVITPEHVKGLAGAVRWIFRQGFRNVALVQDFGGKWTPEDFDALAVEYEKLARFWYRSKKEKKDIRLGLIQDKVTMKLLEVRQRNYGCFVSLQKVVVAANGNVFPCARFVSCRGRAPFVVGNVLDARSGVYRGVWPQKIERFVAGNKRACDGCGIRYRCLAHECGCTSFYTTGSLDRVSPEVCAHERILCAICDEYAEKLLRETSPESLL